MGVEKVMTDARVYLRDPAHFFVSSVTRAGISYTFDTGHPNVLPQSLLVQAIKSTDGSIVTGQNDGSGAVTASPTVFGFVVDEREGLIRVTKPRTSGGFDETYSFTIEGYYYDWVPDADLRMFANNIMAKHAWHREDFDVDNLDDAESDAAALGTAVEALISLLVEYSRDVDINTAEAIPVPATQRFRQVQSLLYGPGGLAARYSDAAGALGVGLDHIEMLTLTRVSRTTNRLVPKYRPREWDDARIPQRIFSPIGIEGPTSPPADFVPFPGQIYDSSVPSTPNP